MLVSEWEGSVAAILGIGDVKFVQHNLQIES